jgi:eukaryotic-like serine/threonine-protein kinase
LLEKLPRLAAMPDEARILELVQEVLDSNSTPENVCVDCPELLPEVRKRWNRVRRMDSELAAIFPVTDSTFPRAAKEKRAFHPSGELPKILGYEVEAVLGHGGMGVVYQAKHLKLNRQVALKMLIYGSSATPLELARFQREAEAVAALRHPQIVQIFDVGEADGRPYYTMEFVEGGSLSKKLAGKPQPANVATSIAVTLADAIQAAHNEGIVHRDLKPANILLTSSGNVKISDFGLARRFGGEQMLTFSAAQMGTPSYMAPEQALGKASAFSPSVDIYALGALLYEMLTGRPPFSAETSAETQRQVIHEEPALPSRLNANVPRDLETICLKCLNKDPSRRYATAAALADDLRHFLRGEPIEARRAGALERIYKWFKRRPALAGLVAASFLFIAIVIAVALQIAVQQADRRHAIEADLLQVSYSEDGQNWHEAETALQRAGGRLGEGGPDDLRQEMDQARSDLELVSELDRIRMKRVRSAGDLAYYKSKADEEYLAAFKKSGIAKLGDQPQIVATRIEKSPVRKPLIAALDDWAICAADNSRREWLLAVSKVADPDPLGWNDRVRAPAAWDDLSALAELAEAMPVTGQSVSLLLAFGERLEAAEGDATAFLRRVQKEHPANFQANMDLGDALFRAAPVEAAGYYRAALASRPEAAVAYTALADSLRFQNKRDEAIGFYRQALKIDPNYARGQTNLANFLKDGGQIEEAIECYRKALKIDPNYAWAHLDLANALRDAGRSDEALEHYQQFHQANSKIDYVENILRSDRVRRGQGEKVRIEWKKVLDLDPPQHGAWFGYAELCLFLGDDEAYLLARKNLLRRFGDDSNPYVAEQTSRAVLLAPPSDEELIAAVALADRAAAATSVEFAENYQYFLFAKGLAEYREGHFDSAISIMNGKAGTVLGPCPRFVIAMAKYRLGDVPEAKKIFATEIGLFDWSMDQVRSHDQWLWHILRREAQSIIFPNTAAFLQGKYAPQENFERLALVGECRFRNLNCAAAKLYADAFAADPTLTEDARCCHRYNAACAAALAGAGIGNDADKLGENEKAAWRKQSCKWLTSELESMARRMQSVPTENYAPSIWLLKQWQINSDLAGLRDHNSLEKLPADERQEWIKLWSDIARLIGAIEEQVATKTR